MNKLYNEKKVTTRLLKELDIMIEESGVNPNIRLKVAKEIFNRAGIGYSSVPKEMAKAYDLTQIAVMLGVFTKNNKPAIKAVYVIARVAGALDGGFEEYDIPLKDIVEGSSLYVSEAGILKIKRYLMDLRYPSEIKVGDNRSIQVVYKSLPFFKKLKYFDYYFDFDNQNLDKILL